MQSLLFSLALLFCCVSGVAQTTRITDSTVLLQNADLRKDSIFIKEGTDSVFRRSMSGATKYLFRTRQAIYDKSGLVAPMVRYYADTLSVTTGNAQTINISNVGFTKVLSVQAQVQQNTSTANDVPVVAVKDYSNTQVTLNIVQGNNQTVSILGINVLGFRFLQAATGVKVHLLVLGY